MFYSFLWLNNSGIDAGDSPGLQKFDRSTASHRNSGPGLAIGLARNKNAGVAISTLSAQDEDES
jgi:hypothetical protein